MARFVGVDAYEAAGGPVLRDLFADEHENGVWLENPALLIELAMKRLQAAADELSTRWKWAEAMADVDWSATARFGRIHPEPAEPTDAEKAEIEKLRTRHDELANMDEDEWTDELVEARARFKPEDFAIAGCIATIGRDGTLQVIQGLVKPEYMPKPAEAESAGTGTGSADGDDTDSGTDSGRIAGPAMSTPVQLPKDREAEARKEAGVGIGLGDDLRSIRTALVKATWPRTSRPRSTSWCSSSCAPCSPRATPAPGTRSTSPSTRPPTGPRPGRTTTNWRRGTPAARASRSRCRAPQTCCGRASGRTASSPRRRTPDARHRLGIGPLQVQEGGPRHGGWRRRSRPAPRRSVSAPRRRPADTPDASGDADPGPADKPRKTSVVESIESPAVADRRAAALAAAASNKRRHRHGVRGRRRYR